jgi:hypothetical protein
VGPCMHCCALSALPPMRCKYRAGCRGGTCWRRWWLLRGNGRPISRAPMARTAYRTRHSMRGLPLHG